MTAITHTTSIVIAIAVAIWRIPMWLGIMLAPFAFLIGTLIGAWAKGL